MISTEKLKARAKAIACQIDSILKKEMSIMTKQNRLTITVNAFFSEKYFLIFGLFTGNFKSRKCILSAAADRLFVGKAG
ncbi:MAG: hypothetical protein JWP27_1965 [Flaviaesturariibacter sp.]|nr:hypothetical protein [Flaviaesturariibacter sp.]